MISKVKCTRLVYQSQSYFLLEVFTHGLLFTIGFTFHQRVQSQGYFLLKSQESFFTRWFKITRLLFTRWFKITMLLFTRWFKITRLLFTRGFNHMGTFNYRIHFPLEGSITQLLYTRGFNHIL